MRFRLSIIPVLLMVPMTVVGCTCEIYCSVFCLPEPYPFNLTCYDNCLDYECPLGSFQGCIDSPDECAAVFELYQAAIDTCEAYPEECAEVLDCYAQSFDTDAEE
jgi:hypothetical protein